MYCQELDWHSNGHEPGSELFQVLSMS